MMRSLLYVPANTPRFIAKAHERHADVVILDLEDSVPAAEKTSARDALEASISSVGQNGATVFVRVNSDDDMRVPDAVAAAKAGAHGIMVPKVESAESLSWLGAALEPVERTQGRLPLGFIALIESPRAVLNAATIASAQRLIGMAIGGEDLALALGATPTPAVLHLPKLLVHYAAKAQGLLSFGLLRSIADYSDHDGIEAAAREAREHGFDGATCVHPSAVPLLNAAFMPSKAERAWAERVLAGAAVGHGAFKLDGNMVDAPVIARARNILSCFQWKA